MLGKRYKRGIMEVLDTIALWQVEVGDLIQFEVYDEDDRYIELMKVKFKEDITDEDGDYVIVMGESMHDGDSVSHVLDPYLEVEIMGA
jgi:hypothetical protein